MDTDDEPFNIAASRNAGIIRAERNKSDVAIIADACVLAERDPTLAAIASAFDGLVHLPYDRHRQLSANGTKQYSTGTALRDCHYSAESANTGGVYVATPSAWRACGGQDEEFKGWGGEDNALYIAHATLLGKTPVRHPGYIYCLHHSRTSNPNYGNNLARLALYQKAAGDSAAIRKLVRI
ncbi:galactosyltransferase-related protein [Streptomyces arboris]|uniref:galactosyltransferase-related protein n=1 Tax=Streptomyces arboris TaxID=2600619 RepID=UPI00362BADA8